jgi:hypothetical protein
MGYQSSQSPQLDHKAEVSSPIRQNQGIRLNPELLHRWISTLIISLTGCISTCGNSIMAPSTHALVSEFHGPEQVAVLSVSLTVLGLGYVYGRRVATHPLPSADDRSNPTAPDPSSSHRSRNYTDDR